MTNNLFWNTIKPLMTNKGSFNGNKIILEENGNMIYDEKTLVEIFNEYYINIVENTTNVPSVSIGNQLNSECDSETVIIL